MTALLKARQPSFHQPAQWRQLKWYLISVLMSALIFPLSNTSAKVTATAATEIESSVTAEVQDAYGKLPLFFIGNEGQLDKRVHYYERGQGHATLFTREGLVLNLTSKIEIPKGGKNDTVSKTRSLAMSFRQANPDVDISARNVLPTLVNLFHGNKPDKWRTGIQTYAEIDYHGLYKGIDARFYGKGGALEYDMVIAPGSHPETIEIDYQGIQELRIAKDGSLEIDLGDGVLRQSAPVTYQLIDGQRVEVASAFRLIKTASKSLAYGFSVANYDYSQPLIIDPSIVYSSYFGGGLEDIGHDVTVDDEEQAYFVGETASADLLPVAGFNGGTDVFLFQLNRQGNSLLAATYIGGTGIDRAYSVVRNQATGSVIISGETQSTNFPVVNGFQATQGGTSDVFVLDFDPVGNSLLYSTYMGGSGIDLGWDVADDAAGVIYIAGETRSTNFPVTAATAMQPLYGGSNNDGFFAEIDTNLTGAASLVYSSFIGSISDDVVYSIDVDAAGMVYLAGRSRQQFVTTANAYQPAFGGQTTDGFIAKIDLNQAGTAGRLYSTFFGGNNADQVLAIRIDNLNPNIIYIAGDTASTNLPLTAGSYDTVLDGTLDAFVAKLDISLGTSGLLYSSYLGGDGIDTATGVDADAAGNMYVTGVSGTPSVITYPTTVDAFQTVYGGGASDGFFSMIDTTLSGAASLVYSSLIGGNGVDEAKGMFLTQTYGQAYLTGSTTSSLGFPISAGPYTPYQDVPQGGTDVFVMRLAFVDNTPSGTGVVAPFVGDPADAVTGGEITFNGTVTGAGSTWLVSSDSGPQEPSGFKFGSPPVYYYLESTVNYNGSIEICFDYNDTKFAAEQSLKLQYWNGSGWDNITVSVDTVNNRICGSSGFSTEPFVVSEPDAAMVPVMSYSAEAGYGGSDGVDPDNGDSNDIFTFKVVYANAANVAPTILDVCIDGGGCYAMSVDSSAALSLRDGDYSNGEQYVYTTTLAAGTHNYYFVGTNDAGAIPLPPTGTLSGPVVIEAPNNAPVGVPTISGTVTQGQLLTADTSAISDADGLGTFSYQWLSNGSPISGATASTYTLTASDVGTQISVQVSYTDGQGTAEGPLTSSQTAPVANTNDAPVGVPTITGTVTQGQQLSADTSGISDADGLGTFSYQWLSNGSPISGATSSTYTLTATDVGTQISVQVSYTDGQGAAEGPLTSSQTVPVANTNDAPVGVPTITGTTTQGQQLTADTSGISDADGLGTFSYQWLSNGSPISGATSSTYTLTATDVGTQISVEVSYTDGQGTVETVTSAETVAVAVALAECIATPAGSTVIISPQPDFTMTFDTVSVAGDTCVTRGVGIDKSPPTGYVFRIQERYTYDITSSSSFSGLVSLCMNFDPADYKAVSTLRIFHHNGSSWDDITTNLDTIGNVICGLTSSFSPFMLGEEFTTAISLVNFQADRVGQQMVVQWQTQSEIDNWGFRILRSESASGPFAPINDGLIPARGGIGLSMTYSFVDSTIEQGKQYYYQLQDVDSRGLITAHNSIAEYNLVATREQLIKHSLSQTPALKAESMHTIAAGQQVQSGTLPLMVSGHRDEIENANDQLPQPGIDALNSDNRDSSVDSERMNSAVNTRLLSRSAGADGADPVYKDGYKQMMPEHPQVNEDMPSAAFSVTIKDDKGYVIDVSRSNNLPHNTHIDPLALSVRNVEGITEVSWQVGKINGRGFSLLRTEKDQDNYQALMDFIPNYGENDSAVYNYRFTDSNVETGKQYIYRLEVLARGLMTVRID